MANTRNQTYLLLLMFHFCWITSGCQTQDFSDITEEILPNHLVTPEAEYRSVAWLDEDHIAFSYRQEEFGDREADRRIGVLTLSSGEWRDISLPPLPENCFPRPSGISHLSRLPDGNLGFVQDCMGGGIWGSLYMWDKDTDTNQRLQTYYERPFFATYYTFAPDMSELIQEDAEGSGLSNDLYRVNQNGEMESILTQFVRASAPSWSPDGETIVFSGTETNPERTSNPMTWGQIESLASRPWDLYLMDEDGGNVRLLMADVGQPNQIKWFPERDDLIAFASDLQETQGVWILDINTLELTRVWEQRTFYNLSPDGQKMVIIAEENNRTFPVIVDLTLVQLPD